MRVAWRPLLTLLLGLALLPLAGAPAAAYPLLVSSTSANQVRTYTDDLTFTTLGSGLSNPQSLALSADQANLYVADRGNNRIARIYRAHGTTSTFAGVTAPRALVWGPDGMLYASQGSGELVRISADGSSVTSFVSLNGLTNPQDLVFGPDGTLYVANGGSGNVLRFDSAGTALGAIGSFDFTTGITIGADGLLYVAGGSQSTLYRLNTDGTGQIVLTQNMLSTVQNIRFDPMSGDLLAVNFGTQEVLRYSSTGTYLGVAADNVGLPFGLAAATPEPGAVTLFGLGALGLLAWRRKRRAAG